MKRLKISLGILGVVLLKKLMIFKILSLNLLENLLNMQLGTNEGITVENVLISIAFGLMLYFVIKKGKR